MSEARTNCIARMVGVVGLLECEWDDNDEACDDCGYVPQTLYADVDYWGECNQYLCTNCAIKLYYANTKD